ncbi:MAG: hypothetical protein ACE5G2_06750 [Candidatus Krumholzibacteriia bacterium]
MQPRLAILALLAVTACGDSIDEITPDTANQPPETTLTRGPPDSTGATSYRVHFAWSGQDPDGSVEHFDYILVDHPVEKSAGASGLAVTVPDVDDPRWTRTDAMDSTFITTADTPSDETGPGGDPWFERWHTFVIRAVDDQGGVDETPDYRSFNSRTLAPTIALKTPVLAGQVFGGPPTIVFNWEGNDPIDEIETQLPESSRWVIIPSQIDVLGGFTSFPESLQTLPEGYAWSEWRAWDAEDGAGVQAIVTDLERVGERPGSGFYIFAVQARDEAGAVTPVFDWQSPGKNNVALVRVSGAAGPVLTVSEPILGPTRFVMHARPVAVDAAAGQGLEPRWEADASHYGGEIADFRHGWDIQDPSNPEEWDVDWSPSVRSAPLRAFTDGTHTFSVEVRDNVGSVTSARFDITIHALTRAHKLLLVDDSEEIVPGSGQEQAEDARWQTVLTSLANQAGFEFDVAMDVYDLIDNRFEPPPLDLLFDYEAVVWVVRSARDSGLSKIALFFDPFAPRNWGHPTSNALSLYLENGGKIWVSGNTPARLVWPAEARNLPYPQNVTNWDDPIEPHPTVDSAGTTSFLYRMGVEMFDLGAGTGFTRNGLNQFCGGLRRVDPEAPELFAGPDWPTPPRATGAYEHRDLQHADCHGGSDPAARTTRGAQPRAVHLRERRARGSGCRHLVPGHRGRAARVPADATRSGRHALRACLLRLRAVLADARVAPSAGRVRPAPTPEPRGRFAAALREAAASGGHNQQEPQPAEAAASFERSRPRANAGCS